MVRFVLLLFATVVALSLLRAIIGFVWKAFSLFFAEPITQPVAGVPRPAPLEVSGELKRDPVCATYISTTTSIKKVVKGETLHFCSDACRDKFRG